MVTFATLLVTFMLFIFLIGIDMTLFKATAFTSIERLFYTHLSLGKHYLIAAMLIAFISALIVDYRRKKTQ